MDAFRRVRRRPGRFPVQRCGSLQRGEPCDTYEDYGLGVRCIVHGGGFPDAMIPGGLQREHAHRAESGFVAISYELIHDTRVIPLDAASPRPLAVPGDSHLHGRRARPLGWHDARRRNHAT